jgi:G3E family GTPase
MSNVNKISIVIITGFLGSGKTTVLNRLLKSPGLESTAVIVNEFGEIGIDHLLVETSTEQMIEINNGCICCTIRGDLSDKLQSLAMWMDVGRIPPVERVIVETTGLADPAPIMHTLMTDGDLLRRYELRRVVTLVDGISGPTTLDRFPEAVKQIAIADRLIISKQDLVGVLSDWDSYSAFKQRLRTINSRASIHETIQGAIAIDVVVPLEVSSEETVLGDFSQWLDVARDARAKNVHDESTHSHAYRSPDDIQTFIIKREEPIKSEAFNTFLQDLVIEFGEHLLRMKGILCTQEKPLQPAIIQGVQHVFFPVYWLERWPDRDRCSKLVFITQGIAPKLIQDRFDDYFCNEIGALGAPSSAVITD